MRKRSKQHETAEDTSPAQDTGWEPYEHADGTYRSEDPTDW